MALLAKSSLDIDLVQENMDDIRMAQLLKFKAVDCKLIVSFIIILGNEILEIRITGLLPHHIESNINYIETIVVEA